MNFKLIFHLIIVDCIVRELSLKVFQSTFLTDAGENVHER